MKLISIHSAKAAFTVLQKVRSRTLHYHLALSCLNFNMIWVFFVAVGAAATATAAAVSHLNAASLHLYTEERDKTFACITINFPHVK